MVPRAHSAGLRSMGETLLHEAPFSAIAPLIHLAFTRFGRPPAAASALRQNMLMPSVQSPREIDDLLAGQLVGRSIGQMQVLGINSLKSLVPPADALTGEQVHSARSDERVIVLSTAAYEIRIDLQRTGRVTWLKSAQPWQVSSGTPLPTVRLLLEDGTGLDFTEPAKTKRVTVTLLTRPA